MSSPRIIGVRTLPFRLRRPGRTARLRLALLFGCVFLACGAGLLTVTYLLVSQNGSSRLRDPGLPGGIRFPPGRYVSKLGHIQQAADLHTLLVMSAVALALMAAVSVVLGWLIAGRVLRPLRAITSTARHISATNLHRRLALAGPDDELKELGDTLDALLGRLEVAFESQRRFVANASHELRTPLARLKTLLQVALADPGATFASLRSAQERALAAEQELERLLDGLLALASGEQALQRPEPIDLAAATSAQLQARASAIERRKLRVDAMLDHAWIEGDRQLLERLVANLLDNAIVHNTPEGWLQITTSTRARLVVLSITNSGTPIPPNELDRLKQPFQRLTTDRTHRDDGHGLGLSIIAAIAMTHRGALHIHPRPEGGLHAQVELPSGGVTRTATSELADEPSQPCPPPAPRNRRLAADRR